jgi:putative AdoMet-dependent methyltransferase
MDEGDHHEVLYYLELQRSVMFSHWVELKHIIETTDRMIDLLRQKHSLVWEDIYQLAEGSKRLRDRRKNWSDRWNFDRLASSFDDLVPTMHLNYNEALHTTYEWVAPKMGEIGLDIGTGTGNLAGRFIEKGVRMAGIDQSREMLKQCQLKYPQMETKLGNFLAIPYLDHQFDFVVTSYALQHLTDEQKILALEEARRVLKPHGRICITDLMFVNEEQREKYLQSLMDSNQFETAKAIQDKYYADSSQLISWFEKQGYITKHQQVNDLLHIVYAVPTR